jgi:Transposase
VTSGLLRVDHGAVKREAHLDGKWLLRTSDTTLTPDDLAAAYEQLLAVERGWRDFKGALGLRPVFHHREDRIRAHIQLCWLALLLLRVIENATADTWRNLRHELDRMHLVTLATDHGRVAQRSAITPGQQGVLRALDLPEPPSSSTSPPSPATDRPRTRDIRSNTTPHTPRRVFPAQTPLPQDRVLIICGSPVWGRGQDRDARVLGRGRHPTAESECGRTRLDVADDAEVRAELRARPRPSTPCARPKRIEWIYG